MRLLAVVSLGSLIACGSAEDPQTLVTGETLTVFGQAALGCEDSCPEDEPGMSYQTPSNLHIGVAEVELLRSADDAAPHSVMVAIPAHDADLVAGTTFAAVDIGSIPEATYTHMRVTLDWISYTVDATGHTAGYVLPGTLDVDYALSNHDDDELGARIQGDYLASFNAVGMSYPQAGNQPVEYPPSHPNGTIDTSGGTYRVTYPSEQPIVIEHGLPESVDVDITYFIDDAFGWTDRDQPTFTDDIFDLSDDPATTEIPERMAIQGYAMDVCDGDTCTSL